MRAESCDRRLGVLAVDGASGAEKAVYGLERRSGGWRTVTAVVDSGAEETVAPPGLLPGQLESSPMSRSGGRFRAANGTRIANLGQQDATFSTPDGHSCRLRFQIAAVERPLVSVSQLAKSGHSVEFLKDVAMIVHKASGRQMRLPRVGGVYVLRMRVRDATPAAGTSGFSRPGK